MTKIAIIGATTWGNTLGRLLSAKGTTVGILARTEAKATELNRGLQTSPPENVPQSRLSFTHNINEVLSSAEIVICAVPAQSLRQNVKLISNGLDNSMILVSVAKGLEADTGKRMSEVMIEEIAPALKEHVCVLSGPNLSREINNGLPATSIVAAHDIKLAKRVQKLFDSPQFSIFICDDVIGVELCGALKNVIALGAGIVDGLGLGDNAKAALITLGWAEVVSLGIALGAKIDTFYGLAGLGDLIATCSSSLSRNHYVGFEMAKGNPLTKVTASMSNVAEGIDTAIAAHHLASKLGLEVPLMDLVYRVLFESLPPAEISTRLRDGLKPESAI